ncbi:hypothetical protein Bpfe_029212 [Biomphalaria pfeifferi]|uniref:Uncharacterized protein n=1 Tax=Biomphalaria pfeifferi TaxID=112525 RepID=A0AAD8AS48_BIOPF|nr:hypothetical protein Bpfe_029212 [Biomphalaria pfeifferi]
MFVYVCVYLSCRKVLHLEFQNRYSLLKDLSWNSDSQPQKTKLSLAHRTPAHPLSSQKAGERGRSLNPHLVMMSTVMIKRMPRNLAHAARGVRSVSSATHEVNLA